MRGVLIGLHLCAAVLSAAEFHYRLDKFPKSAMGCHAAASEAASLFSLNTKVVVLTAACLQENSDGYLLDIAYEAPAKLRSVSTDSYNSGVDDKGRYTTKETCVAALPEEVRVFQAETNLTPVFAYCVKMEYSEGDSFPWYPKIEGFGDTIRPFRSSGFSLFSLPYQLDGKKYREAVFATLAKKGVRSVSMVFRSHGPYGTATAYYYSESRIGCELSEMTEVDKVDECLAQVTEVESLLATTSNRPAISYCGKSVIGGHSELNVLFAGDSPVSFRPSTEHFKTYPECQAERLGLVTLYQIKYKLPVRGGLCSRDKDAGGFTVMLLEDRKEN